MVGTFDVDQLIDYRARRPTLTYQSNAFTDYQAPELLVHQLTDTDGTLVPAAVRTGAGHPVGAFRRRRRPGRRPVRGPADRRPDGDPDGRAAHPADRDVRRTPPGRACCPSRRTGWAPSQVPGHAVGLLEYRFGQAGRDTIGFAAHVPHYIARSDYPETARTLIQATADATGLLLPTSGLDEAAATVRAELAKQVAENTEVAEIVQRAGAAVRRLRLGHRPWPAGPVGAAADRRRARRPVRGLPGRPGAPRQLSQPAGVTRPRPPARLRRRGAAAPA